MDKLTKELLWTANRQTNERKIERTYEQTNERKDEPTNERANERINERTNAWMHERTNKRMIARKRSPQTSRRSNLILFNLVVVRTYKQMNVHTYEGMHSSTVRLTSEGTNTRANDLPSERVHEQR